MSNILGRLISLRRWLSSRWGRRSALYRLADQARRRGDWKGSAEALAEILGSDERDGPLWVQYGHALKESGELASAEAAYRRAGVLMPADADLSLQFGHLYKLMGRLEDSLDAYLRAHRLDPRAPDPRRELDAYRLFPDQLSASAGEMNSQPAPSASPRPISAKVLSYLGDAEQVFVIRGDIRSTTGYAKAARALGGLLAARGPVLGVPLHVDPQDDAGGFRFPIVADCELIELARGRRLVVVHHTTPEHIIPIAAAVNVSAFYWETRIAPARLRWRDHLEACDAIWAPTTFVAQLCEDMDHAAKTHIVAWAHDFELRPIPHDQSLEHVAARYYPAADKAENWSFAQLRASCDNLFLAVQSLSPRKGLPQLLGAWRRLVAERPDQDDILLLKLSFRHTNEMQTPEAETARLLERYAVGSAGALRIAIVDDILSDQAMLAMTSAADALVSCSYGEGFGAPIAEALAVGTPVIAPRHTGLADLLPVDYPFLIDHAELRVPLVGNPDVYPAAATWCVASQNSVVRSLRSFLAAAQFERREAARIGARYASDHCSARVVEAQLSEALRGLEK